jgi:uncharacterized membrane protein YkvA (DUF1232 family)
MPVFNFDFNRSVTNLDMSAARSGVFTPGVTSLDLHDDGMIKFNAIAKRLDPGRVPFSVDQIAGAARRVLRASMKGQESAFIKVRMRRAGEVRAALKDKQWSIPAPLEAKMRDIIAYLDDPASLIPNDVPVVGYLDDAILVDIAMDSLRGELENYADFCRFRWAEAARLQTTEVEADRAHWMAEREQEHRLEQQLRRVRTTNYTRGAGSAGPVFRIC